MSFVQIMKSTPSIRAERPLVRLSKASRLNFNKMAAAIVAKYFPSNRVTIFFDSETQRIALRHDPAGIWRIAQYNSCPGIQSASLMKLVGRPQLYQIEDVADKSDYTLILHPKD